MRLYICLFESSQRGYIWSFLLELTLINYMIFLSNFIIKLFYPLFVWRIRNNWFRADFLQSVRRFFHSWWVIWLFWTQVWHYGCFWTHVTILMNVLFISRKSKFDINRLYFGFGKIMFISFFCYIFIAFLIWL